MKMKNLLFKMFSLYPPFLGAGIRVKISKDVKTVDIRMKLRFWNRNYVRTHYGGSLYSMCDPFYFFLLMENLGPGYIVWDKSASIVFKKPGRGTVHAHFFIPDERYAEIRNDADREGTVFPEFSVDVVDENNEIVAVVTKQLYIKKKQKNQG